MKLLIVTQKVDVDDPILGFFHRWIQEFAKHCESIVVICLYEGKHNLPDKVKVLSLGKESGQSRLKYILNFYKYIWSERKNYERVFVHMNPVYAVLGGIFWRLAGKKISLWYTHKHVDLKLRMAEKIVCTIFSASRESFRLKSDKLRIMGHGIDTDIFKPIEVPKRSTYTILSVGRISSAKNQSIMIDVMNILNKGSFNAQLLIVGDAITNDDIEYKKGIIEKIKLFNLSNNIKLVGSIKPSDTISYYQNSDLFINLSSTGSLDKAILEAMSSGLNVITSNEAFKDILPVENFTTNNIDDISNKIKNLINKKADPKLRDYIVENHQLKFLIEKLCVTIENI
jgi:glycosyltransferase involved in cell wall biosynthesis